MKKGHIFIILAATLSARAGEPQARRYPEPAAPVWWKGRVEEIEAAVKGVQRGVTSVIASSPGGRPVHLVAYGKRIEIERTANYNSAAGAGDPRFFARKPYDAPPIVFLVGPPHGHEVEGMVGLVNLLQVAETGKDLRGKEWVQLRASIDRVRLLVVPIANPDGRARCAYDSFVGLPVDEMTRVGQGTRKDGTLYGWPGVKARHPMTGDVGLLGAYFNDAGINLMHDEFLAPMAAETKALLQVARDEAPDYVLNLHSHGSAPQLLPTAYVPRYTKETAARLSRRLADRFRGAGLPSWNPSAPAEDGEKYPPPSFNLTSALHHVSGAVSTLFECPQGFREPGCVQVTHDQILDLELTLFDELLAFALETPRPDVERSGAPREVATLHNGISLKSPWPPRVKELSLEPELPSYLISPPDVIPIDVGRQLFVDDFLIQSTTLDRSYHLSTYHPASPILEPDRPWEIDPAKDSSFAMVFSDGVWFDPRDRLFKMWYMGGPRRATCLATSEDGIRWQKPALDVEPGTNVVQTGWRDSSTVWLDHEEKDPAKRFKMFRSSPVPDGPRGIWGLYTFFSADGIHWSDPPLFEGPMGDRTTVFWNPFRKVWVFSLRSMGDPRQRRYWEAPDLARAPLWTTHDEPPLWLRADHEDPMRADLEVPTQLYNLDCVAYESILLGLFTIWRGQPSNRQKPNDIVLGYSRDGWSWHRPDRRAFCAVSEKFGDWNYANVQSAGGGCLVVGDSLHFYVSGRGGELGTHRAGACSTGLAVLRRDGFASMDAGDSEGVLTTRRLRFSGRYLFVNLEAPQGELTAEAIGDDGSAIPPFTREGSVPVSGDRTLAPLAWKGAADLSALAGKPVRLRFHLRRGSLYAFWVSSSESGASGGYVAAGGPGFTGPVDTVGSGS